MNATRTLVATVGIAIVVGGIYLLYFQADLDRYIGFGELTAAVLVAVGLIVITVAIQARRDTVPTQNPGATIVDQREIVHEHPVTAAPVIVQPREPRLVTLERDTQIYGAADPAERARPLMGERSDQAAPTMATGSVSRPRRGDTVDETETKRSYTRRVEER